MVKINDDDLDILSDRFSSFFFFRGEYSRFALIQANNKTGIIIHYGILLDGPNSTSAGCTIMSKNSNYSTTGNSMYGACLRFTDAYSLNYSSLSGVNWSAWKQFQYVAS